MCRTHLRKIAYLAAMFIFLAAPSIALDSKTIRDISRADTPEELNKLADSLTKSAATRKPKDFEEGAQIAAETSSYLLYIIAKQNVLLMKTFQTNE